MASLTKNYSTQKTLGQIYTPFFIVEKILNDIGYNNKNILGKYILDPACGDGRFLTEIVKRIIQFSKPEYLKTNLLFVYGWDIDYTAISSCINNLNEIIKPYNIEVNWNIKKCNSLLKIENNNNLFNKEFQQFDFIVGNPPYIRIQHVDIDNRIFIQKNYNFCKSGSTDIYYAFYELSYHLLNNNGICGLITPNTFFYSETGLQLRNFMSSKKIIKQITNYGNNQVFNNATTYSTILIFNKKQQENFLYQQAYTCYDFIERNISFAELFEKKIWQLSIEKQPLDLGVKLKKICNIHVGITTLCDKVYIFEIENIDNKYVWAYTALKGKIKIEKEILKPIIKASTFKNCKTTIYQYVLFPYKKINNKHKIIPEHELQNYPLAYNYLLSVKEILDKRDNGKTNKISWYAFGRSQGLDTSFGKKILFSPMNLKPNFILSENEECTFYSGYCIKYNKDYTWLLKELNSKKMEEYIQISSRDYRGGWKAYNKQVVQEFSINFGIVN